MFVVARHGVRRGLSVTAVSGRALFNCGDMKCGESDAPAVVKPNYKAASPWIDARVISSRNVISMASAGNDCEGLERNRFQVVPDISNHLSILRIIAGRLKASRRQLLKDQDSSRPCLALHPKLVTPVRQRCARRQRGRDQQGRITQISKRHRSRNSSTQES